MEYIEKDGNVYKVEIIQTQKQTARVETFYCLAKKLSIEGPVDIQAGEEAVYTISAATWKEEPISNFLPVDVYLDGEKFGENQDGEIRITFEETGMHVIEVLRSGFEPARLEVQVS